MRLTIALDDLSLPLPPMRRPDNRQRVIEAVLEMAADAGVDDVVLIAALGLHRRMTFDAELRQCARGPYLRRLCSQRCAPAARRRGLFTELVMIGKTEKGEDVEVEPPGAESRLARLREHKASSRWTAALKSTSTGLMSCRSVRHHHNVKTLQHSRSLMDRPNCQAAFVDVADRAAPRPAREGFPRSRPPSQQRRTSL